MPSVISSKETDPQNLWTPFPHDPHSLSLHLRACAHLGLIHSLATLFPEGQLMSGIYFLSLLSMASNFSSGIYRGSSSMCYDIINTCFSINQSKFQLDLMGVISSFYYLFSSLKFNINMIFILIFY